MSTPALASPPSPPSPPSPLSPPSPSTASALPIVDMAALRSAHPEERAAAVRLLRAACEERGFFYAVNHGVPTALCDAVLAQARGFFAQPDDAKRAVDRRHSRANRGWEPLRAQTLEAGAPPDLKESFYLGVDLPETDARVAAGKFNHGPNQWPAEVPGFRPAMERYFDEMMDLGGALVRGLAQSLSLPAQAFDGFIDGAMGTLRLLHYPPQPANPSPREKGCGEHTDFGCITLLLQDDCGGLEVWDAAADRWIAAPPVPGAYVVNLGDLVARWTDGRYHSTLHRVVNRSGRERYSVPFFFTGRPDHLIEALPGCVPEGQAPRHPPVTVEQHLAECYRRSYG